MLRLAVIAAFAMCIPCVSRGAPPESSTNQAESSSPPKSELAWEFALRRRVAQGDAWRVQVHQASWKPQETAIIVCDMWDYHHSKGATERVGQLASRMNLVLDRARAAGALVIHAPSACMEAYADHPARQRAQAAPRADNLPQGIDAWLRWLSEAEKADFPIDDSDGGADDEPEAEAAWHRRLAALGRKPTSPWKSQIDALQIDAERDVVSDNGSEIWNVLEQRRIRNVLLMGVHANMCVLGRPFGLRQMAKNGRQVALVRDLTDVMYNPAQKPRVSHFTGIDLIVEHVERHVCPTLSSDQLLGDDAPFRFPEDHRRHIVALIGDDEYESYRTLPKFALAHLGSDFCVTYVHDDLADPNHLHDLEALQRADLMVVSMRRRMLSETQLGIVQAFAKAGKPVVGIRTASHAFAGRGEPPTAGRAYWPEFDAEVLGGNYHDHHNNKLPEDPRTFVEVAPSSGDHPIVQGLPADEFVSPSWLYKTQPLGPRTELLMTGRVEGREPHEPVAWTNMNKFGGKAFYTSLGHPGDFEMPAFQSLLRAGIYWALGMPVPDAKIPAAAVPAAAAPAEEAAPAKGQREPLGQTLPLEWEGDIASRLVDSADAFLLGQIGRAAVAREETWKRGASDQSTWDNFLAPRRRRLEQILGLVDARRAFSGLELVATTDRPALIAQGKNYDVWTVRWPVLDHVTGEGLMLVPRTGDPVANVIALPHCDVTPEQLCGLEAGMAPEAHYARRLAESGCRVVIPALISRAEKTNGITQREWLHRAAYEMGRTMTGYELQKALAIVDWLATTKTAQGADVPTGMIGWGDGGLLALYAAALDSRIDAACVSGALGNAENLWQQPIDRMVFSLLSQFGDAELAAMTAPRTLVVESGTAPATTREGGAGGPYRIAEPSREQVRAALARASELAPSPKSASWLTHVESKTPGSAAALSALLTALSPRAALAPLGDLPIVQGTIPPSQERQVRQLAEIEQHTQSLLRASHWVRKEQFWDKLDASSIDAYSRSTEPFRKSFYDEVIGRIDLAPLAPRPRTRWINETPLWRQYEVTLEVFDGLFAYGILTLPKGITPGERRPAVVCQHGLEGRPQDVVGEPGFAYYKAFAAGLAERGFVTFAPQNLYIFEDRFRTLQRKANVVGKTLFSLITPQHQQIVDWLQTLEFVDPQRIGFYGLSYGGKTAMRVPPLVTDYALSICSADFNEWVDKNASTLNPRSYVNSGEYEIFEWNLGHTFNYAEMAALIAPRPFMVERGHFDGVADDWTVAWEYARVRLLYAGLLKIPDRTAIEWFDGPHSINGQGTYQFLHRHLAWPTPEERALQP